MKPEKPLQFTEPTSISARGESLEASFAGNEKSLRQRTNERVISEVEDIVSEWLPESMYVSTAVDPETAVQYKVIDIEKIKSMLTEELRVSGVRVSREKIARVLFEKHKDDVVLISEQVERSNYTAKPLFYYPSSLNDATSSVAIADADFHIPLWDIVPNKALGNHDTSHPLRNGETLTVFEVKAALALFHPRYGDGRRDPRDGKLYLKNPDYDSSDPTSPKRLPFSRDLLRAYGLRALIEVGGEKRSRSMRTGIQDELPHLLASNELKLEDVREITLSRQDEVLTEFSPKRVGSHAHVMLRGVNQYVGRRFANCIVYPFGADKALIFKESNGEKALVAIFTIVGKENASDVYVGSNGNQIPRANADKTALTEIKYEAMLPQHGSSFSNELRDQKRAQIEHKVTQVVEQLLESARLSEELVRSEMSNVDSVAVNAAVAQVRETLLNQAERAITQAATATDSSVLEKQLTLYAFDARTYVAIMQSIGVEKMISNPLDKVKARELTEEQREAMRRLLRDNYEAAYPGEANAPFRDVVAESLNAAFLKNTTDFYLLKDDADKIVGFNRFDTYFDEATGRTILYFGSFNADAKYRGVGGIMLESTIQGKLKECDAIQAHCDPRQDITKKYIEDGFIATETADVAGNFSFEIWRSGDSSLQLKTKQMTEDELLAIANVTVAADADYFVREVEPNDQFLELDSGLSFLLTRYFDSGDKTYAAFELNGDLSKQFVTSEEKSGN